MKKYSIIAPHPDDELIGCFQLFDKNLVDTVYYLPIDEKVRKEEAERFCKEMKVKSVFLELNSDLLNLDEEKTYFVPSILDHHPLHKMVNSFMFGFKKGYYSIDMNTEFIKVLSKQKQREKEILLYRYYESQKSLWETDRKYVLFEGQVVVL